MGLLARYQIQKYDGDVPGRLAVTGKTLPLSLFPKLRATPRQFVSSNKSNVVISDDAVVYAKSLCAPTFRNPPIGLLIHELRLFGTEQSFTKFQYSRCPSANDILLALTDETIAIRVALGIDDSDYISRSPYGVHVALLGRDCGVEARGESHFGQLAAAFGSASVGITQPMIDSSGQAFTVRELLNDLALSYRPDFEQEFFATAMTHYLDKPFFWTDEAGQQRSIDDLLDRLVSQSIGSGSCFGTHTPYAVTMIMRMDAETHCLSRQSRKLGLDYLRDIVRLLKRSQEKEGTWLIWADVPRPYQYGNDLDDRINVTGHHLEWLALAPTEIHLDSIELQLAADGLIQLLSQVLPADRRVFKTQLPLTHAARALVLWSENPGG